MMFSFGSSIITFVDHVAYMEIHVSGLMQKDLFFNNAFGSSEVKTEHNPTFLCPCKPNDNASSHPSTLFIEDKLLQCPNFLCR